MLTNYGYIGLYLIVAVLFTILMLGIPVILRLIKVVPHHPNAIKNSTFECGVETIGKTWVQFNFRYYFYALIFITMDVLVIFVFPWAVGLKALGYAGLVGILVLILIVVTGYIYAWKKKVLQWQ